MTDNDRDFGRVEGKLDGVVETLLRIDRKLDKQDDRLSKVENRQSYFMGGAAVIGSLFSFLVNKVFH
jgi:hypothetical protein